MWYLSEKVAAEQIELHLHSNLKSSQKKNNFNFNNDIFDIDSVEVSDSNHWIKRSSSTEQKYQKVKEISQISKIVKSKIMFMRILFKLVYSSKKNLNEIHLSRKFELQEMLLRLKEKNSIVHINTAYKWKADKIQLVNLEKTMSETLNKLANWQKVLWTQQIKHSELIKSDLSH